MIANTAATAAAAPREVWSANGASCASAGREDAREGGDPHGDRQSPLPDRHRLDRPSLAHALILLRGFAPYAMPDGAPAALIWIKVKVCHCEAAKGRRSNPGAECAALDCFVASLLAMTSYSLFAIT